LAVCALLGACQSAPKTEPVATIVDHPPLPALARTEIVFTLAPAEAEGMGLAIAEGGWRRFMDEEVTPRFPEQVSVVDGIMQWRADAGAPIDRERSKVLTFVHAEADADRAKVAAILVAFEQRFPDGGYRSVEYPVTSAKQRAPLR
jgi:hypothetical protein